MELTGRSFKNSEELAECLWSLLKANDDALVMGSAKSRDTLIDGEFDLVAIADGLISRLSGAEAVKKGVGDSH